MIGTTIVDTESLYFGLAKLYLGDSVSNESSVVAVLGDSAYFGCLVNVSFEITKTFQEYFKSQGGIKILNDIFFTSPGLTIITEFIELTEKNFSYSLGGDGSDVNVLNNLISQPPALRAELVFTYPNKTNSMTLILPKVKVITKTVSFNFKSEDPISVPVNLITLQSTHTNWSSDPMGKMIFS